MNFSYDKKAGYTIAELLAVVALLVIITGVITGILYSTLRGSNKTTVTTEVTQQGNYALSVFSAAVIDSKSVKQIDLTDIPDCTQSPKGTSITLRKNDDTLSTFTCTTDSLLLDGESLLETGSVKLVEDSCSLYCSQSSNDPYAVPIVGIKFELEEAQGVTVESQASAKFDTAVTIRNYSP